MTGSVGPTTTSAWRTGAIGSPLWGGLFRSYPSSADGNHDRHQLASRQRSAEASSPHSSPVEPRRPRINGPMTSQRSPHRRCCPAAYFASSQSPTYCSSPPPASLSWYWPCGRTATAFPNKSLGFRDDQTLVSEHGWYAAQRVGFHVGAIAATAITLVVFAVVAVILLAAFTRRGR